GMEFLDLNREADNWHLHLEVFDPHEPFDCPQRYRDLYEDTWDRYFYTWPPYDRLDPELDDPGAVAHMRKCYAGTLSMADHWLGRFLDKMDENDMWKDTTVVLTTDHGHLLGEHGYWAKNYMFDYEELTHIPLFVAMPQTESRRTEALTATMDLMPTILDLHGVPHPPNVHGKSLLPILEGKTDNHHDAVLFGFFGKDLNLVNDRYSYCRQPIPGSIVHHHTAMPRGFSDFIDCGALAGAEIGTFLPHCKGVPHYRISRKSHSHRDAPDFNPIYDLQEDPGQTQPIRDAGLEAKLAGKLHETMERYDAPPCQFERMGMEK
ncbi:sulfatase-like hydrolase/transferase, partial [bacterium]|nr:sulfatase-like hydrolase/transferase [bacterium]